MKVVVQSEMDGTLGPGGAVGCWRRTNGNVGLWTNERSGHDLLRPRHKGREGVSQPVTNFLHSSESRNVHLE